MTGELLGTLRRLELALQDATRRRDPAWLDRVLHEHFVEFGRSGRSYSKQEMIEHLAQEGGATAWSEDFRLEMLGEGIALLTYRSVQVLADGTLERHTLRSSIWTLEPLGWQLRFHQGTPTADSN